MGYDRLKDLSARTHTHELTRPAITRGGLCSHVISRHCRVRFRPLVFYLDYRVRQLELRWLPPVRWKDFTTSARQVGVKRPTRTPCPCLVNQVPCRSKKLSKKKKIQRLSSPGKNNARNNFQTKLHWLSECDHFCRPQTRSLAKHLHVMEDSNRLFLSYTPTNTRGRR